MNNPIENQDVSSGLPSANPIFLDKTLLSPTPLAVLILLAMTLSALAGWKIINIEAEHAQIMTDRAVLKKEQDILQENLNLYKDVLVQLPTRLEEKKEIETDIAKQQGEGKALGIRLEALQSDLQNSQLRLQKAQDDLQAAKQERNQLQKEVEGLTIQKASLSKEVAALEGRDKIARSDIETLETRLAALQVQVDGFEKRRKELDINIGELSGPESPLAQVSERLKNTVNELQDLGSAADKAADNLAGASKKAAGQIDAIDLSVKTISKTAASIDGSSNKLDSATRGLEDSQQSLERLLPAVTKASEDLAGSVNNNLTPAVDSLTLARKEINIAAKDTADSAGSLAEVSKQAKEQVHEFADGVKNIKDAGDRSSRAVDALLAAQQKIDQMIAELTATANSAGSTATTLSGEQKRLKDSVDAIAKVVLSLQEKQNADEATPISQKPSKDKP